MTIPLNKAGPFNKRGLLVALCGLDGAGKTTQLERITTRLSATRNIYKTKQPTDWFREMELVQDFKNLLGDQSELLLGELALLSATDRLRHHRLEVEAELSKGNLVLTDRHIVSTFTSFLASGFTDVEWLKSINRYSLIPDLVVFIDVPPETVIARVKTRTEIKKQEIDLDLVIKTRQAFLDRPWGDDLIPNYHIVDGTAHPDEVEKNILALIDQAEGRVAAAPMHEMVN